MTTRRQFLRLSTLAAAAGCTLRLSASALAARDGGLLYGVQMYTVRHEAAADLAALLRELRKIGFTQLELHPIVYAHPAAELRRMIEDAGLHVPAGHFTLDGLPAKLDYAHELGLEYMVTMLPNKPRPESLDDYRAAAKIFQQSAEAIHQRGMTLAYLCHNHEFQPQQGTTGFAQVMKETDPALVKLEVDVYWIVQAGLDPAAFLREHRDRVTLLHLKDRLPNFPTSYVPDSTAEHFVEMGKGTIPWPSLIAQARRQGIRYAFMDQDSTTKPLLESLQESFTYLQSLPK